MDLPWSKDSQKWAVDLCFCSLVLFFNLTILLLIVPVLKSLSFKISLAEIQL